MRIPVKDPRTMTESQLEKENNRMNDVAGSLASKLIEAGRGLEKYSETAKKTDPLSKLYIAASERGSALYEELKRRRLGYKRLKNPLTRSAARVAAKSSTKKKSKPQVRVLKFAGNPPGGLREIYKGYFIFQVYDRQFSVFAGNRFIGDYRTIGDCKRRIDTLERKDPLKTEIYADAVAVIAKKGPGHKCDEKCRKADHTYIHEFKRAGTKIFGNKDGSLTFINKKK